MLDWSLFHCAVPVPLLLNDPFLVKNGPKYASNERFMPFLYHCHFMLNIQTHATFLTEQWGALLLKTGYDIFSCRGWVMVDQLCWRLLFLF